MTQNSDTTDGKSDMCDFLWADLDVIHRSLCLADVEQFGNEGSGQFVVDGNVYIPLHDQHTLLNKSYIQNQTCAVTTSSQSSSDLSHQPIFFSFTQMIARRPVPLSVKSLFTAGRAAFNPLNPRQISPPEEKNSKRRERQPALHFHDIRPFQTAVQCLRADGRMSGGSAHIRRSDQVVRASSSTCSSVMPIALELKQS
ncbi:hypothetical protein E1301_Tti015245 [Triplophysa tibetana]|uniref:Uncharacterized protein n=1 Tax=Triplophysa tibetana TaxID=1572043 RepID=A0A5A9PWM8_9TELE|nr:hypothetical protein E1301_Tti015245 [Triplophysa tibetana]